jgi:hypothetical protein
LGREVSWVTFNAADGGLIAVQSAHVAAIYDEQGAVKLATTAGSVHVLKEMSVRRAMAMVAAANRSEPE